MPRQLAGSHGADAAAAWARTAREVLLEDNSSAEKDRPRSAFPGLCKRGRLCAAGASAGKGSLVAEAGQQVLAGSSLNQYDDAAPADYVASVHDEVLASAPDVLVGVITRKEACDRIAGDFGFAFPQAEAFLDQRAIAGPDAQEGLFHEETD